MNNSFKILKCVDCNNSKLTILENSNLLCNNCNRVFYKIDNIYSMLPKELDNFKKNEIISRDNNSLKYDSQRPSDYVFLLDYYCIDSKKICSNDLVLDLACGTGRTTLKLAKLAKHVFAIDFSIESLKVINKKLQSENLNNVTLIQADVNTLPLNVNNYFNFINATDFLQHIPSFYLREKLLKDSFNYLVKDGYMSITSYNYSSNKKKEPFVQNYELPGEHGKQGFHLGGTYYYNFSVEELYALLAQCGFNIIENKLFYFSYPLIIRIINKVLRIKRANIEKITYNYLKNYAERIYFYVKK